MIPFIFIGLAVVLVLIVVFRSESKNEFEENKEKYVGKDTKQFSVTSDFLNKTIDSYRDHDNSKKPEVNELEGILKTSLKSGLTENDQLETRRTHFGINEYASPPLPSYFGLFIDSFEDRTLQILLGSAILSMILGVTVGEEGGWVEGVAILAAVLLVSSVTAANDYNKEVQFRALSSVDADKKIKVIRGGNTHVISTFDILVGDIVVMEAGDIIPADCIYISGEGVKVDESSLTGEPEHREVNSKNPALLSGCTIQEGMVRSVVVSTGMNSVYGRVKALSEKERSNTPLQDNLEELADFIGQLGMGAAALTFIALIVKWGVYRFYTTDLGWEWSEAKVLIDMVITAITIVAMAVPEGLPLAVTISLAYSMIKMTKDQNLVRHLAACETMGGATQICSDKTGTLTQNKMTVTHAAVGKGCNYDGDADQTVEKFKNKIHADLITLFIRNIVVNSSANVLEQNGKRTVSGSASEIALLEFAKKLDGVDIERMRKEESEKVISSFAFTSTKKRMSTLIKQSNNESILFVKGASEVVLEACVSEMNVGAAIALTTERKKEHLKQIEDWASKGLRTLALAFKTMKTPTSNVEDGSLDTQLTLIGLVGIKDPVREEVPEAVVNCQNAGIVVRMLTGDNILTAKDIASQCNILTEKGVALEGPQFRKMSDEEIKKILPNLQVIARCTPEDKLKLVKLLRADGEVVAVTGDGTNDAPQLNEADVGFAMGIAGTEVARQASDIILLDDNFNSILKAVLWGRNVFLSIKKFIQFQLTVNICAVILGLVGAITTGKTPLTAVQLLWVNLIMDTFAALALATDPPTKQLLKSPPYGRKASLITYKMWVSILGQVVLQLSLLIFLLFVDLEQIPFFGVTSANAEVVKSSMTFNVFVFCQLFNELNCRKVESNDSVFAGIFSNKIFVGIMVFSVLTQVFLIQYGGSFVHTCALNSNQWLFCVVAGACSIPVGAFLRIITFSEEKTNNKTERKIKKD